MKIITCLFLLLIFNTQNEDKVYFGKYHNYSTVYSYCVTEIHISSDSVMTRYDYKLPKKKEWRNYKKYIPEKSTEIISKKGKYYSLINPTNHLENNMHCLKITNKKLTYYFKAHDGSYIKGYTFDRKK